MAGLTLDAIKAKYRTAEEFEEAYETIDEELTERKRRPIQAIVAGGVE